MFPLLLNDQIRELLQDYVALGVPRGRGRFQVCGRAAACFPELEEALQPHPGRDLAGHHVRRLPHIPGADQPPPAHLRLRACGAWCGPCHPPPLWVFSGIVGAGFGDGSWIGITSSCERWGLDAGGSRDRQYNFLRDVGSRCGAGLWIGSTSSWG